MKTKNILVRYGISTLGLIFVALGVGLSMKSNLGIAPPSCPPNILWLQWPSIDFGTYTWLFNFSFIVVQFLLLRKKFPLAALMQIPAILVFGYLCDGAIWLFNATDFATSYGPQLLLTAAAIVTTAIGIRLEIVGQGWTLPVDKMNAVISEMTHVRYSNIKILCDIVLVAMTAVFSWFAFGLLSGDGIHFVIREGTLILAVGVGLCMKLTDPLVDGIFGRLVK